MVENLKEILEKHLHWINESCANWRNLKADLSNTDLNHTDLSKVNLSCADLIRANLNWADLSSADLSYANLSGADLSHADLSDADLSRANLKYADLSNAILSNADLSSADLAYANLSGADLKYADLSNTNLSNTKGLISSIDYLKQNFEFTKDGIAAYKTFNSTFAANLNWKIKPNSIITENVNANRTNPCGCGINVAPLTWVKENYKGDIWKVLIKWEWLCGVIVPYNTDGKIRCEKVQLIEIVDRS